MQESFKPSLAARVFNSGLSFLLAGGAIAVATAGCGQKGPLTLPPASAASAPAAAASR